MRSKYHVLKQLKHPYYIVNIVLALCYFTTKLFTPLCALMYEDCEIQLQECEMLVIMGSFVAMRKKRQISIPDYVSHLCLLTKILNVILFWRQNLVYSIIYALAWIIQGCFLREPEYSGPDRVLYLRDTTFESEVLKGDPRVTWLIAFYTAWSPSCVKLQQTFAELSAVYSSDRLKFAKLDIARYANIGAEYNVDSSIWSRQLPTIILFRNGVEIVRRPSVVMKPKKTICQFTWSYENIVSAFTLAELNTKHAAQQSNSVESTDSKKTK